MKTELEEAAEKYANELPEPYNYGINSNKKKGFIEGVKWQSKRMYSEEDLLSAFEAGMMFIGEDKGSFREFFEQFKKR